MAGVTLTQKLRVGKPLLPWNRSWLLYINAKYTFHISTCSEMEKSDLNHQIEVLQEKVDSSHAQLNSQKSLVNKRTQKELSGLRQAHHEVTSRVGDLSQKNNELHQKISELEGTVSKLKDRIKSQKSQIDSYRDLKEKNADLVEENGHLNSRLREFEGVKRNFIKKNKEQTATISAFMKEVEQLQRELKELSHDQKGVVRCVDYGSIFQTFLFQICIL